MENLTIACKKSLAAAKAKYEQANTEALRAAAVLAKAEDASKSASSKKDEAWNNYCREISLQSKSKKANANTTHAQRTRAKHLKEFHKAT